MTKTSAEETARLGYDGVAELYDLYIKADYDVAFFVAEAAKVRGPVLELTAGTGRLSLPLAEAGVELTCVDASRGMLDVLARKLAERGLDAEVHHADACRLDVSHPELEARFELAIWPFQAFMEIVREQDQRAALAAAVACLAPGGRLVCTLHNPALRRAPVDGTLRIVGSFPAPGGTLVVSGFEQGGDPIVRRTQFFELFGPDGRLRWKRLQTQEFALIERDAFQGMAESAGFRVAALYGDYGRAAFDPERSPFMIWVLEKKRE